MKKAILFALFLPMIGFTQEKATTETGKKVILKKDGTWEYTTTASKTKKVSALNKELSGDKYMLSQVVLIETGKEQKVEVTFNASVPKQVWDELASKNKDGESDYFALVASMLSINAKYTLKNPLSFEPFSKQFFMYMDGAFMSSYKMSGKNGYGNSVETTALVKYDPLEK